MHHGIFFSGYLDIPSCIGVLHFSPQMG
uniref:Uncharacterized protein n=1 Tax=Rhizophora mucronata TaxID=61149 RepID=A0A2P2PSL1_RHIMU